MKVKKLEAMEMDYRRKIATLSEEVMDKDIKIRQYEKKIRGKETHRSYMESARLNLSSLADP